MEGDGVENGNRSSLKEAKFTYLKSFANAARAFEATHSESAFNMMNSHLELIASSRDLSIFSPDASEVCAFFSSLWGVMCDPRGPHWAGITVLARASIKASTRHALTHTYKFLPILTRLLSDTISDDKKIKLLSLMQDISHGMKIIWQESYLTDLMKQLTKWIKQPISKPQQRTIRRASLSILANVCYENPPAIYALTKSEDFNQFKAYLFSFEMNETIIGVELCRMFLCLNPTTERSATARESEVHYFLKCSMHALHKAIVDKDLPRLLHTYTLIKDLCIDSGLRSYVLTYTDFTNLLQGSLENIDELFKEAPRDMGESENTSNCLCNVLKILTILVNLDIHSLRIYHAQLVCVCRKSSRFCLPESLELFAAIVSVYKDEHDLSQELLSVIRVGLSVFLVPHSIEPRKIGLQWLKVMCALCESSKTRERVLQRVTPKAFEDILYSVLQYTSETGPEGADTAQSCVVMACRAGLALAPLHARWEPVLARLLAKHQVCKALCAGLTSGTGTRRSEILQLIKHQYFPLKHMNLIFGDRIQSVPEINNIPILKHINTSQQNILNKTRIQNDIHKKEIQRLLVQLKNTEKSQENTEMKVREKKLEERLKQEETNNRLLQKKLEQQNIEIKRKVREKELEEQLKQQETNNRVLQKKLEEKHKEIEMKVREKELEERLKQQEANNKVLQQKLKKKAKKNSVLLGALMKGQVRMPAAGGALRQELKQKDIVIEKLKGMVEERENRLFQRTLQLKKSRVQEMVNNIRSNRSNANFPY